MKSRKVKSATRSKAFMKKLKGTVAVPIEDEEFDANENQDSDDNEDETQPEVESSSEEEVLPITDDDSDNTESDAENQGGSTEEDEDLPNLDYWGKKKSIYYNADFVDKDRGKTYRDEDLEQENAEREAVSLQQKAAYELDQYESSAYYENYDRAVELISKQLPNKTLDEDMEMDDEDSPEAEKLKHEKRKYPKLLEYKEKFREKFAEVNFKLAPLIELATTLALDENFLYYVKLKYQILLHYLLNISFYLYLKNAESVPENHPIYERIEQFKEFDDKMNSHRNYVKAIDIILENLKKSKDASEQEGSLEPLQLKRKNKDNSGAQIKLSKKKNKQARQPQTEETEVLRIQNSVEKQQNIFESKDENEDIKLDVNNQAEENVDEKRTITYQIAKNKGLVARRKKEYRNPRVHHRNKFRRAKIRRKGQVREAIKEIKRYAGEPTGISAHVVRSIKLK